MKTKFLITILGLMPALIFAQPSVLVGTQLPARVGVPSTQSMPPTAVISSSRVNVAPLANLNTPSAASMPAVPPPQVTPEMMSKLEEVSSQVNTYKSNAIQKYDAKSQQVIENIEDHGGNVMVINKGTRGTGSPYTVGPEYVVVGPQGNAVEVSSSRIDEGGVGLGAVQKTITYIQAGSTTGQTKVIVIPHADAKAVIAIEKADGQVKNEIESAVKAK